MEAVKSSPKDAQIMAAILKDMNIADYESRVVNHMLEFTYRYVTDMLDDAKLYAGHAGKKNIDVEDVKLAIQCKLDHSFTTPPPKDLLMDIAKHKNSNALPVIKPFTGPKLPPDRYCLSAPNYRLRSLKKPRPQTQAGASVLQATPRIVNQSGGTAKMPIQVIPKATSQVVTVRPSLQAVTTSIPAPSTPLIRINTVPGKPVMGSDLISGTKRKREDDDYDT